MPTTQILSTAGFNTALGIAKESTYGTAVAPATYVPFEDHNLTVKNKLIQNMAVRKSAGQPKPGIGTVEASGSITTYVDADTIGPILGAALGADAVTGSSSYTHTMKLAFPLNSYTFSADDGQGSVSQYVGCKVNQMDISCKPDDFLKIKIDVLGQTDSVLSATSLSPTFSTKDFFEYAHLDSLNGGLGASTLNGAAVNIVDFSIQLKNNLKAHYASTGGRFVVGMDEMNRDVTGSFTINYDSALADSVNLLLWGAATGPVAGLLSHVPLVFTFTQSVTSSISITCPQITIEEAVISRKRNDILVQQVKFRANESAIGAQDDLKIVLINQTAAAFV